MNKVSYVKGRKQVSLMKALGPSPQQGWLVLNSLSSDFALKLKQSNIYFIIA